MKKVILIASLVALVSCHKIHDGKVTGKFIVPAHDYSYSTTVMCGKTPIIIWHKSHAETEYVLHISKLTKKDTISENFSVNKETYECKKFGDYFNDSIPCELYSRK